MLRQLILENINEDQNLLNQILDKINDSGIDSLTTSERNLLTKLSTNDDFSLTKEIPKYLNDRLGNMEIFNSEYKSLGNEQIKSYEYLDKNLNPIFKLDVGKRIRFFVDSEFWRELALEFNLDDNDVRQALINYLNYNYPIVDNKRVKYNNIDMSLMFGNID